MEKLLALVCLLSASMFTSGLQNCQSLEQEVQTNCECNSGFMQCSNLKKIPLLSSLLPEATEIKQILIRESSLGALEENSFDIDYDTVETLQLQKCEVTNIGNNAFLNLKRLERLNLNDNRLVNITSVMLTSLPELQWLDLSVNQLEKVPGDLLKMVPDLVGLDLSFNKGLNLEEEFFADSNIEKLSLHHIGLTSIPSTMLSYATNLKQIGLDGNEIKSIPAHAFVGLPKLEVIALDANGISEIEDGAFEGLPNLKLLNLRNNKITELTPEVMEPIGDTLETIYLEHNLLKTLHTDVIRHDKIQAVRLGFNPWVCDCKIKWMKDLDLKHRDPGNVTCDQPVEWQGHSISDVTEDMLCSWCDGCNKSKLAYAIGIPILIISACLMGYYIYRLIQSRRQHSEMRKVYKYSNVYRDTVEPVRSHVPPSQRV